MDFPCTKLKRPQDQVQGAEGANGLQLIQGAALGGWEGGSEKAA